ncbi:MAG: hypothetical protein ACYCQK_08225 [Acidiferrobacteraceae bacterium]
MKLDRALSMNAPLTVAVLLVVTLQTAIAGLPDPTRPNFDRQPPSGYRLRSVLVSPVRRTAVINGRDVSVGDVVGRARVIYIGNNEVRLVRHRSVISLRLVGNAGIRRSAAGSNQEGGS